MRPEHLEVVAGPRGDGLDVRLPASVGAATYAGSHWLLELTVGEAPGVEIACHHGSRIEPGREVWLRVDPARTWFIA